METPTVMAGRVTSDLLLVGSLPVGSTDAALTRSPHTVGSASCVRKA